MAKVLLEVKTKEIKSLGKKLYKLKAEISLDQWQTRYQRIKV
jgi:hypothetical protein